MAMIGGVRKVRTGHSVQRDSSRMGSWTHVQKLELIALVQDQNPCGAADWEVHAVATMHPLICSMHSSPQQHFLACPTL